ncbi:DUF262 domain-containing protein [Azospirillum formosense]|uniref:DUF262 domain-containing protein n=1 Tax=Azospirillum formosense TaxID=861533 RepID=A0ABX2KUC3_9PROT|nr:DUF262 domain-containing protein [Azospirillum formosense]MBY3756491.1 DUF262 domain-containing protein [Azospirillum formosense]NUB20274.1 DUF262 domain-containing protein [Azospirillum formosense]
MKTSATNKKIRELIVMVRDGKLLPRPEFQRRLVWTRENKNEFIDTVLKGYPFPEIYICDGEIDNETGDGTQLLVDGLQRVSTLIQYFHGSSELRLTTVPIYKDLAPEERDAFLQYEVAVRDLGSLKRAEIVEIFRRLNATKYSLTDIEINNALYSGALKRYAESVSSDKIFIDNGVFSALDFKRMGDLKFSLQIIVTMIGGYFNRDDELEDALARYNDDFSLEPEIDTRFRRVKDFIEECGFHSKSRIWRKSDLFTAFVELDRLINISGERLDPLETIERLESFYSSIKDEAVDNRKISGIYYKAAIQANADRTNRLRRGLIFSGVVQGKSEDVIMNELVQEGLTRDR